MTKYYSVEVILIQRSANELPCVTVACGCMCVLSMYSELNYIKNKPKLKHRLHGPTCHLLRVVANFQVFG